MRPSIGSPLAGAALMVGYTLAVTLSDAMTKHLTQFFEAPQILTICSGTILVIIIATTLATGGKIEDLQTNHSGAMAVRAVMTVFAAILFFYAFAQLPFADVFLFIALAPIFSGLLAAPILKERVAAMAWVALMFGSFGVFLLFPGGVVDATIGHLIALGASLCGTLAIVMGRYIARREDNPLALVFYPQLATLLSMAAISPFVWVPISISQAASAIFCGVALFAARYVLALAMQVLPAHAATTMMNLQFVWMTLIGFVIFSEIPEANTILGALVIAGASIALVYEEYKRPMASILRPFKRVEA
ncbi:MAG: DMT family transporter [Marinovum sp.]|nr:DMT family transporter [Marinovum sp.]